MNDKKMCDLCGLPVEIQGFKLMTKDGLKAFCCEGCRGIYQLLHEDVIMDEGDENGADD